MKCFFAKDSSFEDYFFLLKNVQKNTRGILHVAGV